MPKDATPSDHDAAKPIFSRFIKAIEKKLNRTIRFRAIPHDTDILNRHYDFVAYADHVGHKKMKKIIDKAAKKAGFSRSTCRPISTKAQIDGAVNYVHKTDYARSNGTYQYLPKQDGKRLVWGSKDFFRGGAKTTKAAIWKELKAEWAKARSNKHSNKQIDKPSSDLILEIASYMPDNEQDAVKPDFIDWLVGTDLGGSLLEEVIFPQIPGIKTNGKGGYYVLRNYGNHPKPERKPYFQRIFGQRMPYYPGMIIAQNI